MSTKIRITIEAQQGSGKGRVVDELVKAIKRMGRPYEVFDPVDEYKPRAIAKSEAEIVILVKQKREAA